MEFKRRHCLSLCLIMTTLVLSQQTELRNCTTESDKFHCDAGACIPVDWKCNGKDECGDGSDEKNCGCKNGTFHCGEGACILVEWKCNGKEDCGDGSDEKNCPAAVGDAGVPEGSVMMVVLSIILYLSTDII